MKLAVVVLVVFAAAVLAEEQVPATPLGGPCGGAPCPAAGAAASAQSSIQDAVQPVDDWIKSFKKKMGVGENLYGAARGESAVSV